MDPWQKSLSGLITSIGARTSDLQETGHACLWVFTSVSVRNGLVGVSLVVKVNQVNIILTGWMVGSKDVLNTCYG
jgi:hypothetical protein